MKKRKLLVSLLALSAIFALVGCSSGGGDPVDPNTPDTPDVPDNPNTPDNPDVPDTPTTTEYTATLKYNNGQADGKLTAVKDGDSFYFNEPTDPTRDYFDFAGWFTDEECTNPFNFDLPVDKNQTLYAKWDQAYDTVTTVFDLKAPRELLGDKVKTTEDTTFGRFTVEAGVYFDVSSGDDCLNNQKKNIKVTLRGEGTGNTITFIAKGAGSNTTVTVKNAAGEVVHTVEVANSVKCDAQVVANLPAGEYTIGSASSVRFTAISITEKLPQGPTTGIRLNLSGVTTNFLLGREFSAEGLNAYLTYDNGREDPIDVDKLTITKDDFTTAGKKTVTVKYNVSADKTYTQTYTVNVCEPEELVLYDYTLSSNRVTQHVQVIYLTGSQFKADNLVVKAKCKLPESDDYIEFLLAESEYSINSSELNLNTPGNQSVAITYSRDTELTANYDIEVITIDTEIGDYASALVDPSATFAVEHGFSSEPVVVNTINQAMQIFNLLEYTDNTQFIIYLVSGVKYWEKVEFNVPNLTIASIDPTASELTPSTTPATIVFDALNGLVDPSESVAYSTDGSATVSVRADAVGFFAYNVKFMNYYNTNELYNKSLTMTSDTQAVAALVEADQAVFLDCVFSSYHDTLYARKGRQYYVHCDIEGRTDYIFGDDATAYFDNSTIRSIGAGKDVTNGGYVVATKGNVVGSNNIKYGYIFNNCDFVADENVMDGSVSIARGWESGMTVMVMNSNLGAHISKEAYGNTESKLNDRYTKMNADPVASQLFEYNNEGAGALVPADFEGDTYKNTVTYATAAQAELYDSLLEVFGPYNGTTTYTSAWAGATLTSAGIGEDREEYRGILPNASIVLKNPDGSEFDSTTLSDVSYVGSYVTETQLKTAIDLAIKEEKIPAGKTFDGFYTDSTLTTAFDTNAKLTAETTDVYIKWANSVNTPEFEITADDLSDLDLADKGGQVYSAANGIIQFTARNDGKGWNYEAASGKSLTIGNRSLKTAGRIRQENKANTLKIDLTGYEGKVKLTIFFVGSGDTTRTISIVSPTSETLASKTIADKSTVFTIEAELECGKIYNVDVDNTFNFYAFEMVAVKDSTTDPEPNAAPKLTFSVDTIAAGDITEDYDWDNKGIVVLNGTSGKKFTMDAKSGKKVKDVDGNDLTTTGRLKLNGAGRKLTINLSQYTGTVEVTVWCATGTSDDFTRGFKVLDGTQELQTCTITENNAVSFTFELTCGKSYTLENFTNGINIFAINLRPVA